MSAVGNYKDYVVARFKSNGKTFLFEAPSWSHLKAGDEIDVGGMERPVVLACSTMRDDCEELEMLKAACGTEEIRRINGKYKYVAFEYPDGEEAF